LALFYLLFVCRAMNLVQSYRAPRNVIYICFLTWTRPMTIEHMRCCCCCLHLGTRWTAYFTSALDSELLKSFCENLSVFWLSLNAKKDFNKKKLYVTISAVKINVKKDFMWTDWNLSNSYHGANPTIIISPWFKFWHAFIIF